MTEDFATQNRNILLIEDDEVFSNLVSAKLLRLGYDFVLAKNHTEAFEALERKKPDVILLDLLLPGEMDGFAILKKIKSDENFKNIPIIIVSNLDSVIEIQMGMKLGAFRYLPKSLVTVNEIVENIKSALVSIKM